MITAETNRRKQPILTSAKLRKKQSTKRPLTLKITPIDTIRNIGTSSIHFSPKNNVIINSALKKNKADRITENEFKRLIALRNTSFTLNESSCKSESMGNNTVSKIPFILLAILFTKPAGLLYEPKASTDIHLLNNNLSSW